MADDYRAEMLAGVLRRSARYAILRDYYAGRHRLAYSTDKFRNAFGGMLRQFADNLCPAVVDAVADRLEVTGFAVDKIGDKRLTTTLGGKPLASGDASARDEAVEMTREVWDRNKMDERAGAVHQEALTEGDSYVIVWPHPDDNFPCIYPQRADAMTVGYDPDRPNQIIWAAKFWQQRDKRLRMTAYYPDRVEKWVTQKPVDSLPERLGDFEPLVITGEEWPLPNPYDQVPVFHFANNSGVGCFGRSELTDVVPLQDALNKTAMDLLVAMEYVALPQRYVTGLEVDVDDLTGKPKIPFQVGVDRVWQAASPEVRFGELGGADLTHFIAVANNLREEVARVTGTPLHYFMMMSNPPSGVALRALEARFIKRCRDRQTSYGNVWEDVLAFCLLILDKPDVRVRSEWVSVELADEKEHAETLLLKQQLGASKKQLLREAGYTDAQIDQMEQEKEEEQQASAQLGDQLLKKFGAGSIGGPGGGPQGYPGRGGVGGGPPMGGGTGGNSGTGV